MKIVMGKSQGFHVILTDFSWFNSWDFSHGNPMKKALKILLKSHEIALKNSPLMAHEIFIFKSNSLKIHENTIKFYRVMKSNLMGFSCFWKTHHENYH